MENQKVVKSETTEQPLTASGLTSLLEKIKPVRKESDSVVQIITIGLVALTIFISIFTWHINAIKTDLAEDIQEVRIELKEDIQELKVDAKERDKKIDAIRTNQAAIQANQKAMQDDLSEIKSLLQNK